MSKESIGYIDNIMYSEDYRDNWLHRQNELDVIFSLMDDRQLLSLYDIVGEMVKNEAYRAERFPLSAGGLGHIQVSIMFAFWVKKGKGVRVEKGEIVVCELKESPFWERYQQPEIRENMRTGECYYVDNPEHERDIQEKVIESIEERGPEGEKEGEWV